MKTMLFNEIQLGTSYILHTEDEQEYNVNADYVCADDFDEDFEVVKGTISERILDEVKAHCPFRNKEDYENIDKTSETLTWHDGGINTLILWK